MPATVYILTPVSEAARQWINENISVPDYMQFGHGVAVEHRYIEGIVQGMFTEGLVIDRDFTVQS